MIDHATLEKLLGLDIFSGAKLQDLLRYSDQFTHSLFSAGDHIIELAADNSDVFFLLSGAVRVLEHTMTGSDLELARFAAPGYFGELSAIDSSPRSAEVVALEPCECLVMSSENFTNLLLAHPEAMLVLLKRLAQQVRQANFDYMMNAPL